MFVDSAINGLLVTCRDISIGKKAEEEEHTRKNMQALSENSPDIISRISAEEVVAYVNPAIEEFCGAKPSYFINKNLDNGIVEVPIAQSWKRLVREVKITKTKICKEESIVLNNIEKILQINAIPELEDEVLKSVLIISHDITEIKRIESEIKEKNKKISESINYSKRIQGSIIPDNALIQKFNKNAFILFKPKDVVSGDFPWYYKNDSISFIAAADCTGHGVPGAMLSIVGSFILNDIVRNNENKSPAELLDMLDERFNKSLNTEQNQAKIKDGMDIGLCKIDYKNMTLEYAGAHRPLLYMDKQGLKEIKGDKWAIGGGTYKNQTNFNNHQIKIEKGDAFYLFSDGFPDQFGGPENKKFGIQRIRDIIEQQNDNDPFEIHKQFMNKFEEWKKFEKQMDDVLLIGFKI